MIITRAFPNFDAGMKKKAMNRESMLPNIDFLPDSHLMVNEVIFLKAGTNRIVWAMVDGPGGQPRRIYLFTYPFKLVDINLSQLNGRTVGEARVMFNEAMSEAFDATRRHMPAEALMPKPGVPEDVEVPEGKTVFDRELRPMVPELPSPSLQRAQASAKDKEMVPGGKSEGMTVEDIAKLHGVPASKIEEQIEKGVKVELEHTPDRKVAREIAMDHLVEFANYYDMLEAMEEGGDCVLESLRKFVKGTGKDWNYVTPEDLHKKGTKGYHVVDIRKPEDYAKGHIAGAKNIFWMDLLDEANLKKLPKDGKILLVCYVGHTSSQMVVALRLLGYDAVSLKYGMGKSPVEGVPVAGWLDYGYDVVK
jgi:rhodanese-related sulfurtransferase